MLSGLLYIMCHKDFSVVFIICDFISKHYDRFNDHMGEMRQNLYGPKAQLPFFTCINVIGVAIIYPVIQ